MLMTEAPMRRGRRADGYARRPRYSFGSLMTPRSRLTRGVRFANGFLCLWFSIEPKVWCLSPVSSPT